MSTVTRISYDEFEAMVERGEFPPDDPTRYELIEGEILQMVAPNPPHEDSLDILQRWSSRNLPEEKIRVRVQQSIGLPGIDSIPQPDLTWVREQSYRKRRPRPEDIFLIVEVSSSTLSYDRNRKSRLYAHAGLADYWIINLQSDCVEVLRDPGPRGYSSKSVYYTGDVIHPLASPDLAFPVALLFPEVDEGDGIETGLPAAKPHGNGS